jgi:hypothetical protein
VPATCSDRIQNLPSNTRSIRPVTGPLQRSLVGSGPSNVQVSVTPSGDPIVSMAPVDA